MKYFNEITTRNELADFIGVKRSTLTHILYIEENKNKYIKFNIKKRNGTDRHIYAPNDELKYVQRKLASSLIEYNEYIRKIENIKSNISHGFERDKSFITNAEIHRNKRFVLNLDLKDFFDSFHFGRVKGYFQKNKFYLLNRDVAITIAQIVCYEGKLPQGAPTSPIITNLICQVLDYRILKLSKKYQLDYTRYADDLTFSTNKSSFEYEYNDFITELEKTIEHSGFKINHKKNRLQYKDSQQIVTGLVVNQKINVTRTFYKETKAMAHSLYKTGSFTINKIEGTLNQLEGRFSFINQLEYYNNLKQNKHTFRNLTRKENEYRKFLFYKNFLYNNKPLIITEGKTDVIYIKSALKKLYNKYPHLISKTNKGEYEYKIRFLNRSKIFQYLFGVSIDGADAMKNLLNYFTDCNDNNSPNYLQYFMKNYNLELNIPILFLFDNELANKKKPLVNFLNHAKLNTKKDEFKSKLHIEIPNNSNLYVLTIPLINNKDECEIEDLFDEKTLSQKINGKIFEKDLSKFDKSKHYSKDHFAKFIAHNYENIDFSNFIPILDNITSIVEKYIL